MSGELQRILNYLFLHVLCVKIIFETAVVKAGGGLEPFLTAGTLNGAVPGPEMDPFSMSAADQLDLQVIIVPQTLFNKNTPIAELSLGIVLHLAVHPAELLNPADLLDPHAAAAGRRLDQNRRVHNFFFDLVGHEFFSYGLGLHLVIDRAVRAGNGRDAKPVCDPLGVDLVAKVFDDLPFRTDKDQRPVPLSRPSGKTEIL